MLSMILAAAIAQAANTYKADPTFLPKVPGAMFTSVHPTVMIDQGHHELAAKDGRYVAIMNLLNSDGYHVILNEQALTPELLKDVRILYISAAQKPGFTESEMLAVKKWVDGGGSLLLMADHAPIGDAVHEFAQKFGFEISGGETNDVSAAFDKDPSHIVFSRDNHLIADHAITNGRGKKERLEKVVAFSGQSVKGPRGSQAFLRLSSTAQNIEGEKIQSVGDFNEAVADKQGKGRVVIFGDGTVFTSKTAMPANVPEGMNVPGIDNVKLATNVFRWLAGKLD